MCDNAPNPISYSTLQKYNTQIAPTSAMSWVGKQSSGIYVVPQYSGPGYSTLDRDPKNPMTYYNINSAYGGSECKTSFIHRSCV
jgi:hypothetical protein